MEKERQEMEERKIKKREQIIERMEKAKEISRENK